jgi:uncharacterized membrane protein
MAQELIFSWQFLALIATLMWAIINIVDKHIVSEKIKKLSVVMTFDAIGAVIAVLAIIVFSRVEIPGFSLLLLLIVSGVIWVPAVYFYYKALQIEEVSRVVPLFLLIPIFTAILAGMFLNEIFTVQIYAGILLVVAGAILISFKKTEKFRIGKGFHFILISTLILTIEGLLLKFALNQTDFISVFYWNRIGVIIGILPIFLIYKKDFFSAVKEKLKTGLIITGNNIVSETALIIFTLAIALGPLTLVTTIGATQPLFVLLMAVILSIFFPKILREELGKANIGIKLFALMLMIIGSYLVTI